MSLETDIANLTAEIVALKQRYESKPAVFDERLNQFTASFQATIESLDAGRIYLDQTVGDDNNDGDAERPVQSLDRAVALIPRFGRGQIDVIGDYTIVGDTLISDRQVTLSISAALSQSNGAKPGSLYPEGTTSLAITGTGSADAVIRSGIYDGNEGAPIASRSVVAARSMQTGRFQVRDCDIDLGDYGLFGGGSLGNLMHNVSLVGGAISLRAGAIEQPRLINVGNSNVSLHLSHALPSGLTYADLVSVAGGQAISNVPVTEA